MSAVAENIPVQMPDQMPEPIIFTESAAAKVADLIAASQLTLSPAHLARLTDAMDQSA